MLKYPKACYLLLLVFLSCKEPYNPPVIVNNANYLVVEGVINTGTDSTIIKLSRTVQISAKTATNPELHAAVSVISSANAVYPLTETGRGYYGTPALNLSAANTYSLKIVTAEGKTYQSDFVAVKNSPPIDSVNYIVGSNAIQINVSTHDPANMTTYYRWDYTETYKIHSYYTSLYELQTVPFDTVVLRKPVDQVNTCWATDTSTTIFLASTHRIKQDIVNQQQMTTIPITSDKIADRYSILVKQYALSPDAYSYWALLKRNTEQLGTIFDPQPSTLPGNFHCVSNPAEPVLGYLSVGAVSELRVYIDSRNLPLLHTVYPLSKDGCYVDTFYFKHVIGNGIFVDDIPTWIYSGKQYVISVVGGTLGGIVSGYTATDRFCADCTLRGTNVQPAFWTN